MAILIPESLARAIELAGPHKDEISAERLRARRPDLQDWLFHCTAHRNHDVPMRFKTPPLAFVLDGDTPLLLSRCRRPVRPDSRSRFYRNFSEHPASQQRELFSVASSFPTPVHRLHLPEETRRAAGLRWITMSVRELTAIVPSGSVVWVRSVHRESDVEGVAKSVTVEPIDLAVVPNTKFEHIPGDHFVGHLEEMFYVDPRLEREPTVLVCSRFLGQS